MWNLATVFWGTSTKEERFGKHWSLSPEQSLSLHGGNWAVPRQLLVRAPRGGNKVVPLPHGTSFLAMRAALPARADSVEKDGLRIFSLESALVECSPQYFSSHPTDARTALSTVRDVSGLLARLLEGGHSRVAGRLAGAFRNGGRDRLADEIVKTMDAAGYDVRESDPFQDRPSLALSSRETSPVANRISLLWDKMRATIPRRFPTTPGFPRDAGAYLKGVEDAYVADAYHSLSMEGYRVSLELIERVRSGN